MNFSSKKKLFTLNLLDRERAKSYHKPERFDMSKYIKINCSYQYSTKFPSKEMRELNLILPELLVDFIEKYISRAILILNH